ncbi:MAG: hypothetical protein HY266_08890 [Deltaproteobacteria bacterium]|nr:hypothetical protein [Deltaproteobacteria bacterium]
MFFSESQKSKVKSQKLETTAIIVNGEKKEISAGTTVLGLLNELEIKPQGIAFGSRSFRDICIPKLEIGNEKQMKLFFKSRRDVIFIVF